MEYIRIKLRVIDLEYNSTEKQEAEGGNMDVIYYIYFVKYIY